MDTSIRLVPQSLELLEGLHCAERLHADHGLVVEKEVDLRTLLPMVEQSLRFHDELDAHPPWCGYLTVTGGNLLVGCCGFKGDPGENGVVEIAYFTLPDLEGRGYGSAAAECLVGIAFAHEISKVRAYTLPARNASCRILEKCGFQNIGAVEDPEDGTIWRWDHLPLDPQGPIRRP